MHLGAETAERPVWEVIRTKLHQSRWPVAISCPPLLSSTHLLVGVGGCCCRPLPHAQQPGPLLSQLLVQLGHVIGVAATHQAVTNITVPAADNMGAMELAMPVRT